MPHRLSLAERFFDRIILEKPVLIIICILIAVSFLGYKTKDFRLDASAETLLLEQDKDLSYAREIYSRYEQQDYLIMTCSTGEDLLSKKSLSVISDIKKDLSNIESVASVTTILDVPLLESPPVPIKELSSNINTLVSPGVDMNLARLELQKSPLYKELLISEDLKTAAIIINLKNDPVYKDLLQKRNGLRDKKLEGNLTEVDKNELLSVSNAFQNHRDKMRKIRHNDILQIRSIMDTYRNEATLFLGGPSMIADDLITFIKSDLKIFGIGVLSFLVITLTIIFRKIKWIALPLLCCFFSAVSMTGLLGVFGWEVTVISSNFISLQLIITMAITIHLIVRYRELQFKNPDFSQRELVLDTVCQMVKPCVYTGLTTIAGFSSLVFSNILPVINFGLMMSSGIVVSLIMTFLLFPAMMMLLKKDVSSRNERSGFSMTEMLANFTQAHEKFIIGTCFIAFCISIIGISRLIVENSFIDYFKKTTEIYQGMKIIDQNLGGTTPLDVIMQFDAPSENKTAPSAVSESEMDDAFSDFDEFEETENADKYWFTTDKVVKIKAVHDYLDGLSETGKVLSLGTMMKIAEKFNDNKPLDNFQLALLYSEIPQEFRNMLLKPYVSIENNEVRFSLRVKDSLEDLKRDKLLKTIKGDLVTKIGIDEKNIRLSGLLVLYNNMLQSLFSSQILTLGVVVAALIGMFLVLFRSLKIAIIAIFPSLLSISIVLGVMGWLNIPLDMMTITIASISIGIAVDNTIHYIHRFKQEFKGESHYFNCLKRSHASIGYAMYYTSITIIIGFSILSMSNFIPSIYFGLLTGLAMLIALVTSLTFLPLLLVLVKPFGNER